MTLCFEYAQRDFRHLTAQETIRADQDRQRRYPVTENKIPIATDSAAELHELIGDDATATFESDPNFVDSNPTADASSDHLTLRDTDDMEDSEEEDEEADEEDDGEEDEDGEDEEDEDEEDDDDDDDVDFDDEEDDDEAEVLRTAEPVDVHGPGKHSRIEIERELEEVEEETGEDVIESPEDEDEEEEEGEERRHADRAIDEALRMSGAVTKRSGIAGPALRV
jgi:hypothetical protein